MGSAASKKKTTNPKTPAKLAPTTGTPEVQRSRPSSNASATRPKERDKSPSINPAHITRKDLMISYSH